MLLTTHRIQSDLTFMSAKFFALLVGGLIPAVLLGFAGLFQKLASQHNLGTGPFLIVIGLSTCATGGIYLLIDRDSSFHLSGAGLTLLSGLFWATANGLILIALRKLGASISQLAPLYNMNTLIAVGAGLILLAEWKTVNPLRIVLAAILIIAGGILAARS